MKSAAAGLEPVLKPTDIDIELRYCSTSRVHKLFGLVYRRSINSKQEHTLKSEWVVMLVIVTESDTTLYVNPSWRPTKITAAPDTESIKAVRSDLD